MSVTHEALEKAAREKQRHAPPPPPAPVAAPLATVQPPRRPTRWIIRGVSVAALIVIGLFLWRVAGTFRQVEQVQQPSPPPVAPVVRTAPVTPPPPEPPVETRYKVTGIMGLPGQYSATVNGQLVTESQYVDGAVVKRIERDRVVLDVNGREIVVRYF